MFKPVPERVSQSLVVENIFQDKIWKNKVVSCGLFACLLACLPSSCLRVDRRPFLEPCGVVSPWLAGLDSFGGMIRQPSGVLLPLSIGHKTCERAITWRVASGVASYSGTMSHRKNPFWLDRAFPGDKNPIWAPRKRSVYAFKSIHLPRSVCAVEKAFGCTLDFISQGSV